MIKTIKSLSLTCFITLLVGCAVTPKKPNVQITSAHNLKIKYSGKAAGAGMMLSGTMGAMGMAIGIAIDEGIGKDINKVAVQHKVSLAELLKHAISSEPKLIGQSIQINLTRTEFKLARGEGDPAQLYVELDYAINGSELMHFNTKQLADDSLKLFQLSDLKKSHDTIESAFKDFSTKFVEFITNKKV